ncbi:MAG: hypothetical protein HQL07_00330 [Nitrospirae bacterium]|nr:hypothetical protein [Magnetococcales bacterium]HAT49613.1 hypothetical protein [Alphaproteobacteria bacterium]
MSRPRINLYDPTVFPTTHDWLDATKAFWIVLAMASVLGLGTVAVLIQKFTVSRTISTLQEQKQALEQVMKDFEDRSHFAGPDAEQIQEQEQLEKDIKVKKLVLELLSGHRVGNRDGFSGFFADLARSPHPRLWLTQIQLLDGGRDIVIVGRTLARDDIFHFFQSLSESKIYNGREFQYFQMANIPSPPARQQPQIRFGFGNRLEALQEVWEADMSEAEIQAAKNGDIELPTPLNEQLDAAKNRPNPLALIKELMGQGDKP